MDKQRIKRLYGPKKNKAPAKRILAFCLLGFVVGLLSCKGGDIALSRAVMCISATVDAAAFTAVLLMGIWLPGIVLGYIGVLASGLASGAYMRCALAAGLPLEVLEHGGALAAAGTGVLTAVFWAAFIWLITDTGSIGIMLWRANLKRRRSGRRIDIERGYIGFVKRRLILAASVAAVRAICVFCIYDCVGL